MLRRMHDTGFARKADGKIDGRVHLSFLYIIVNIASQLLIRGPFFHFISFLRNSWSLIFQFHCNFHRQIFHRKSSEFHCHFFFVFVIGWY